MPVLRWVLQGGEGVSMETQAGSATLKGFLVAVLGGGLIVLAIALYWWFDEGSPSARQRRQEYQARQEKYWTDHWNASQRFIQSKRDEVNHCYSRGGVPITRTLPSEENPYPSESQGIQVLARCDFPPQPPSTLRQEIEK